MPPGAHDDRQERQGGASAWAMLLLEHVQCTRQQQQQLGMTLRLGD
jgi:hypothetical protein